MFINKKFKIFCLIFLLIIFSIIAYYSVITTDYRTVKQTLKSETNVEKLKEELKEVPKLNIQIKINGNEVYYNGVEDTYYYYITEKEDGNYINLKTKIRSKEKYKYVILDDRYDKEK